VSKYDSELSVTTFCSFQREFAPPEVFDGKVGRRVDERLRVPGSCCPSFPFARTRNLRRRTEFLCNLDFTSATSQSAGSTQLPIDVNGSHVRLEVFRLTSIRDWRADFLAASSSAGMSFPVPKYISSGV
jgi:hypothetical protein